jgi:hypothetical protein
MRRTVADKTDKQIIKALKAKLAEVGMEGRLSMAKAKEIKAKRDLAKEMDDLVGSRGVEVESGRASRSKAPATKKHKSKLLIVGDTDDSSDGDVRAANDSKDSDAHSVDEEFEKQQKKLDKRAENNVNVTPALGRFVYAHAVQAFYKQAKNAGIF